RRWRTSTPRATPCRPSTSGRGPPPPTPARGAGHHARAPWARRSRARAHRSREGPVGTLATVYEHLSDLETELEKLESRLPEIYASGDQAASRDAGRRHA